MPRGWIEGLAISCMAGIAALAIYILGEEGKEIALQVTSGLGGYIGGRVASRVLSETASAKPLPPVGNGERSVG